MMSALILDAARYQEVVEKAKNEGLIAEKNWERLQKAHVMDVQAFQKFTAASGISFAAGPGGLKQNRGAWLRAAVKSANANAQ